MYWTKKTDELVYRYTVTNDQRVWLELEPTFRHLITSLMISKYRKRYNECDSEYIITDTLTGIYHRMSKYNKEKGKPLSFFTSVVRNLLVNWFVANDRYHSRFTTKDISEMVKIIDGGI